MFDAASAIPSTKPSDAAPACTTEVKNAGKTARIISDEKSLSRLVRPRKKTFRGRPKIFLGIGRSWTEGEWNHFWRQRDEACTLSRRLERIVMRVARPASLACAALLSAISL